MCPHRYYMKGDTMNALRKLGAWIASLADRYGAYLDRAYERAPWTGGTNDKPKRDKS